jgi:hypothetical protein
MKDENIASLLKIVRNLSLLLGPLLREREKVDY